MVFNRNNRKEISAIEDLIEAKIYVNPERQSELQRQRERLWQLPTDELPGGSACTLLCLNLSNDFADALRACLPGWKFQVSRPPNAQIDAPCQRASSKRTPQRKA